MTNHPITSRDTSQGIIRRKRVFKANHIVESRRPLLSFNRNKWEGLLSEELSRIFSWAYHFNKNDVYEYLVNMGRAVPSLSDFEKEQAEVKNPLLLSVREEVTHGKGRAILSVSKLKLVQKGCSRSIAVSLFIRLIILGGYAKVYRR